MPCYHPIQGFRSRERNPSGKYNIVFNSSKGYVDQPITIPCGQCIGCRLERSRQWAIRCVHESKLYENNCFITLTYNPENKPKDNSLHKEDFQNFMKRLRKKIKQKVRYFHCGEYGEECKTCHMNRRDCEKKGCGNFIPTIGRPHYHACLFGWDPPDKKIWQDNQENPLYTSELLNEVWGLGYCIIGNVTFESAAYVARYITKKITGDAAHDHYKKEKVNSQGEIEEINLQPEYTTMSRKPGIGFNFFEKFRTDIYPSDEIIIRGKRLSPPKFYNNKYEQMDPESYAFIKGARKRFAKTQDYNNTPERLEVREEIHLLKYKQLKRSYENET